MAEDTTTIEVKYNTWDALDRRKERGESFDDVIQKLIDNSAVGFGQLEDAPTTELEFGEVRTVNEDENKQCVHHDIATGEQCENKADYAEQWRREAVTDSWNEWHWCEEHRHEIAGELPE